MSQDAWVPEILPPGWAAPTISRLCDVVRGGSPRPMGDPTYFGGTIPFIKIADVTSSDGLFVYDSETTVTPEGALRSRFLKAGSLILTNSATVCVPVFLGVDACIHDGFVAFEGMPDFVNRKYLYYFFKFIRPYVLAAHKQGVTQVNLNTGIVGDMRLLLPPAKEQLRIVAKIEEMFSELDKGVESLTTAREQLKAYRRSVLNRAVVGERAGSRTFTSSPLSAVVEEIGQGWSPRCLNHPAADDETWAVITTTAIQHGVFQEQENKQLPEELEPRPHLAIRAGDILITRAGPRKRVGVACLVRDCRPRLMLCDKAYRIRADTGQVLPEWLELVLNSPSILQEVEELKTGISDSGVNLTQKRFLELEVPTPPLAEQQAVLKVVDSLTSQMTNLEGQIETAMQQSDALRQSILKRAFAGQLVMQAPSDEPASILLERIPPERDQSSTTKRRNNKNGNKEAA